MRVATMGETKFGNSMGTFNTETHNQQDHPGAGAVEEDDGERLCEVFAAMIENSTMTEDQCQEAYAVAAKKGRCHNRGRIGHFAR